MSARGIIPNVKQAEPNQQEQRVRADDIYPHDIPDGTACRNVRYKFSGVVGKNRSRLFWIAAFVIWAGFLVFGLTLNVLTSAAPMWFGAGLLALIMIFSFSELLFGGGKE